MTLSQANGEASMPSAKSLLILTDSQQPLPTRYPHPHKPNLVIPPFIHRTLHSALDKDPPSVYLNEGSSSQEQLIIPHPDTLIKHDMPEMSSSPSTAKPVTSMQDTQGGVETALIDSQPPLAANPNGDGNANGNGQGNGEGPSRRPSVDTDAEVTVKLHLVREASAEERVKWVEEALEAIKKYKGLGEVDTLLLGFGGVDYRGQKTLASQMLGCGSEGMTSDSGSEFVSEEVSAQVQKIWSTVVRAANSSASMPNGNGAHGRDRDGSKGLTEALEHVKALGTLYLPLGLLKELSESARSPAINSMDTPDCHHLPKEYSEFAKEKGIELWAGGGGEGSDPLPSVELHNILQEFNATLQPILTPKKGEQRLESLIPLREDMLKYETGYEPDVSVNWVLGYTLVSRTRNVVKDRGYVVSADLS